MKSLHFCTSEAWGGLELYACTLMVELQKAGVEIFAICAPDSKAEKFLRERHIQTFHLPSSNPVSLRSARFVQSFIVEHDVDILHVHFHSDIWPASLALTTDSIRKLFLSIYMGVPKKNDLFHRFIYRRVNAIFTSSLELNQRLPMLYPVPSSKVHLLPYGRHLEHYAHDPRRRKEIRAEYDCSDSDVVVGTMVRIDPGKGVMDFAKSILYIDAALKHRVKYLIVGEPTRRSHSRPSESPYEPHCEVYRRQIELFLQQEHLTTKITFAGYQPDVVGYLSAMDVFVFPSRDELYSLVVLDAMCMGLPIVAAQAGGNLFQIEDGKRGLLYTVGDSKDLAAKLTQYLNSAELRREHGRAAREFVEEKHSMTRTIEQLLNFYRIS
ncbi:MAG: glycosyltransferase family 4 protein [Ignavibacteriae bacterium]|nr:glycosyltransferase family 4 protein [Ignavibacteria bacterium]MBI3363547.1 glycosyltransferase family 4 protein [Ignavibacteriota bacterium]